MKTRTMIFRMYKYPIVFLFGAIFVSLVLGFYIPLQLADNEIFSKVAESSRNITPDIVLLLLGLSFLSAVYSSFQLWKWERGKTDSCYHCGGIVEFRPVGKYSPHYRCLACGKNRSVYD